MASTSSFPEEDFSCPVCRDVFKDPVVLSCSHSFCNDCLRGWWRNKEIQECPLCTEIHSTGHHPPPRNLALKNLCEAFVQVGHQRASKRQRTSSAPEDHLCRLHAETLQLFCLECQQPVCEVCLHSESHAGHCFRPIYEAALEHKQEVQKSLKPLREKLNVFNEVKMKMYRTAEHIEIQARRAERQIEEQYNKLHQFLLAEEEASVASLREEERRKSQMMVERIEGLNRDMLTLSNNIRAIEEELRAEHISFLQNYTLLTLQDPQLVPGALIDVAKHLGNLAFRVWYKMKDIVSYTPVILDPNTAFPAYTVSDDLTSVGWREWKLLPDNAERFDHLAVVLGSEGFNSGTRSWTVEVEDTACWTLGMVAESYRRKGEAGGPYWRIDVEEGEYTASSSSSSGPVTVLSWKRNPQRVRVQLDWDEGTLSFSDPDTDTHIHTFAHAFTETLFPFVRSRVLKMLPGSTSVTVDDVVRHDDEDDNDDDNDDDDDDEDYNDDNDDDDDDDEVCFIQSM